MKTMDAMDALGPSSDSEMEGYYGILCDFSMAIVEYRMAHNMKQEDLAKYLGKPKRKIQKYESGNYVFSLKEMSRISHKLGLTMELQFIAYERNDMPGQ